MKNVVVVSFSMLFVCVLIGIIGFSYFNKRLTESKNFKESTDIFSQTGKKILLLPSSESANMGAVESSLSLRVTSPSDKSAVTSPFITLRGKTVAQAEVFVNDVETTADPNGDFSVGLTLDEGENPIMVVANDASGNVGEVEITITYEIQE